MTYLCEGDLLYPEAYAAFQRYMKKYPGTMAMCGSVDMTVVNRHGERYFTSDSYLNLTLINLI